MDVLKETNAGNLGQKKTGKVREIDTPHSIATSRIFRGKGRFSIK
jgi:hypothetical protein